MNGQDAGGRSGDGADWERRVADTWARMDALVAERGADGFRAAIGELADEQPAGSPPAAFERACAFDSTGLPERAVPLYREALHGGLAGVRRRRAVIQLASSLRNLDRSAESEALLRAELDRGIGTDGSGGTDGTDSAGGARERAEVVALEDAVRAVLALALTDLGRSREAVPLLLTALASHLPRYQRSMAGYAQQLARRAED
ncbi:tetratricopeptide repeat protein [Streptomyces sp. AA1529]|uniref:tetratricopeptide repeat protein n=1 Tax=Streptomyces sp. AA1529 TaxID=1203257 RepID=UPI003D716650